jgi:hypothetical protein
LYPLFIKRQMDELSLLYVESRNEKLLKLIFIFFDLVILPFSSHLSPVQSQP